VADERAGVGLRCSVCARGAIVRRRSRASICRTPARDAFGAVARVRRRQRAYRPVGRAGSRAATNRYAVAEPRSICRRAGDRPIERLDRFIEQPRRRFAWSGTRSANATVGGGREPSRTAGSDGTFRCAEAVPLDERVLADTQPISCRDGRNAQIDARNRTRREQGSEPHDDGPSGRGGTRNARRCDDCFECSPAKERPESRRAACANCKRVGHCERIAHGSGAERTRYERRERREHIRGDERNARASFA
jgi:hypothetical protein